MKKTVSVPFWIWNLYWILLLFGSTNWIQAIGAGLMIYLGFRLSK